MNLYHWRSIIAVIAVTASIISKMRLGCSSFNVTLLDYLIYYDQWRDNQLSDLPFWSFRKLFGGPRPGTEE
jgi:hypothetical protein